MTKQEELKSLVAEINALSAKEDKTQEEFAAWSEKLNQADSLKAEIAQQEALAARSREFSSWAKSEGPAPVVAAPGGKTEFEKKAGTDLVQFDQTGLPFVVDAEGYTISDKQFAAISTPQYKKAYIRAILGKADGHDFKATLAEGVDTDGGYLVPPDMQAEIIRRSPHPAGAYDVVRHVPSTNDKLRWPKLNYTTDDIYSSQARIKWTGETGAPQNAGEPQWGQMEIDIHEGMMEIPLTRSLMEDRADVDNIIAEELGIAWRLGLCDVIINGNGVAKPHGILENVGGTDEPPSVNMGNPVTPDGLLSLVYGLPPQYQANAKALMEQMDVYMTYTKLKDTANNYIFGLMQNIDGGMARDRLEVIRGKPIVFDPFMPTSGAGKKTVIYGDFQRAYYLGLRLGMSLRLQDLPRDPLVYMIARFRVGGDVVQPRALRVGVQS